MKNIFKEVCFFQSSNSFGSRRVAKSCSNVNIEREWSTKWELNLGSTESHTPRYNYITDRLIVNALNLSKLFVFLIQIILSGDQLVPENTPFGYVVGRLSTIDTKNHSFTYKLVDDGDCSDCFAIVRNSLKTLRVFNHEALQNKWENLFTLGNKKENALSSYR